jgi:uncharacterized Fe-S cluster-containing MiaB family protein
MKKEIKISTQQLFLLYHFSNASENCTLNSYFKDKYGSKLSREEIFAIQFGIDTRLPAAFRLYDKLCVLLSELDINIYDKTIQENKYVIKITVEDRCEIINKPHTKLRRIFVKNQQKKG